MLCYVKYAVAFTKICNWIVVCHFILMNEPRHVLSKNEAFQHVQTKRSIGSLLLSIKTPNDVPLVV